MAVKCEQARKLLKGPVKRIDFVNPARRKEVRRQASLPAWTSSMHAALQRFLLPVCQLWQMNVSQLILVIDTVYTNELLIARCLWSYRLDQHL